MGTKDETLIDESPLIFQTKSPTEGFGFNEAAPFQNYQLYIKTPDISQEDSELFRLILHDLHQQTGVYWKPGLCRQTVFLQTALKQLVLKHMSDAVPKIYQWPQYPGHSWTVLERSGKPLLIIDAAGLNGGIIGQTTNLPFFGTLEGAKYRDMAYLYYSNGIEIGQDAYALHERLMQNDSLSP